MIKIILFGSKKRLRKESNLDYCTKKDFLSKSDQFRRKLRIWSRLLKKSWMENFIFCAVDIIYGTLHFLGCVLDKNLSREPMALQFMMKINARLRFLCRKWRFLSRNLCRLMCNAMIQHYFDYACSSWHSKLNKVLRTKLQTFQYQYILFCLNSKNRAHLWVRRIEKISWLRINYHFEQCITSTTFLKFFNNKIPAYMMLVKKLVNPVQTLEHAFSN